MKCEKCICNRCNHVNCNWCNFCGAVRLSCDDYIGLTSEEIYEGYEMRDQYGLYKDTNYYKWDLALAFLTMSNDAFFMKFGFNYIPNIKLQNKVRPYITKKIARRGKELTEYYDLEFRKSPTEALKKGKYLGRELKSGAKNGA